MALLRAVGNGDTAAAERLVARYWDDAYRIGFLLLHDQGAAEEVAQDTLLSAIASVASFDLDRGFRPWLQRIATNKALDRLRQGRRRPELVVANPGAGARDSDEELADAIARDALPDDLIHALARLDTDFRSAVVLRHLLDYEPREIAEMIGVPAATVRTRIHRGLMQLRDELSNDEGRRADERLG